ncbi:uncharacterized protein LOC110441996 [Mizuhopecten yessoensis]|uniref:uncharacterized protein LOC110441996 n=1 Tax=Mizuhopecten yessoensis TaxID=6573 RepID=UPI000B45C6E4|nr:uncharacterized protein LOC110441996 [Mizuhopecten yessoensis]XP_021341044.1 uncharacterized protein LOC110441996 [Mizuhopecten yessoensis]
MTVVEVSRTTNLITSLILVVMCFSPVTDASNNATGSWVDIFNTFKKWNGTYKYSFHIYPFSISVNSAHIDTGIYATFSDADATFDISGYPYSSADSRIRIIFTMTKLLKSSPRFSPKDEFQIAGYLNRKPGFDGWMFQGNATKPDLNFFQGFNFSADNGKVTPASPYPPGNESLRVGLTIGVSLVCALIGVAAMVAITVWAIRKGYLRHVPTSYENFKNPRPAYRAKDDSLHI